MNLGISNVLNFFGEEEGTTPVEIAVLMTLFAIICLAAVATVS